MPNLSPLLRTGVAATQAAPKLLELDRATDQFEGSFVKDLLDAMRRGSPKVALGQSLGGDQYRALFDQAFADALAETGAFGIGRNVFDKLAPMVLAQSMEKTR